MIVEIGTSDFRTLAGKENGLFIEPVKAYFDRLPECTKLNIAISNYEGEVDVYYIEPEDVTRHNMPNWMRGCNSIGDPHPTAISYGYQQYVKSHKVKVKRIKTVLEEQGITAIDLLKIDTEGHDCIILNDYLDTVDFLPKKIQFENNYLSDETHVGLLIKRLEKYYNIQKVKTDIVCQK